MNHAATLPPDELLISAMHHKTSIRGHYTSIDFDHFEIEIDKPFSTLRDSYIHDLPEVSQMDWYFNDGHITKRCRNEAKKLLIELYKAALLFDHERQALKKILLDAMEQGHDHIADIFDPERVIDEAFGINLREQIQKTTDPDGLGRLKDDRPYEQQRDEFVLNRISYQVFFKHKVRVSRATLAQLIQMHFNVKLICSGQLDEGVSERQQTKRSE
jgi:hypothetical protein